MLPNLKSLRREASISQQSLAEEIGVSQQSINQYENHSVEPDIDTLTRMAEYFDTTIDYIVGRTSARHASDKADAYYLSADEYALVEKYRALTPRERRCVEQIADTLLDR